MKRMAVAIAAAMAIAGAPGLSQGQSTSYSSVPANIADAPVDRWMGIERADEHQVFQWRMRIPNGLVLISRLWSGIFWPDSMFSSEDNVLEMFRQSGLDDFSRIASVASHGSQWGYMAMGKYDAVDCLAGAVMDHDNHSHDGDAGGTLRGFVIDCGSGAANRYAGWKTWLRSFKGVPNGYNAALD